MTKLYRVTPKNKDKWIVQKVSDRATVKQFKKKTDAENFMYGLIATEKNNNPDQKGMTFKQGFKMFADWKLKLHSEGARVNLTSLKRYEQEYRLRIAKYMKDNVLLSNFNLLDMEDYLDSLKAAGVSFKTMKKSVGDIKHMLKRAKSVGLNPCMDMLTFDIRDHLAVLPKDDAEYYPKEIDINILDAKKVSEIMSGFREGIKAKDHNAINTFAIFHMLFFFGLRQSEMAAIKKDYHSEHSCIDIENNIVRIRGVVKDGVYINKTKNRGSKRNIEIDVEAAKFLDMWLYFRMEYKPDNIWLLPGKNGGPLSYNYIHDQIWKTYAKHGLANIECKKGGHVNIISSPLQGFPTKVFRHRFSSHMIAAMNTNPLLDKNRVKNEIGHTLFSTSENVYGNKLIKGTNKDRVALAKVKAIANKSSIFSEIFKK